MLCLGNKQISPTLITEVGAYGDDLNALNLTGATLNVDDKVWLSPMYLGDESVVNQFGDDGSQYWYDPVVVSRDGSTVYSPYSGKLFNTSTKTAINMTKTTSNTSNDGGVIKYADNGMIWSYSNNNYNSGYEYWISVGGNSYGQTTHYAYVGGDYYFDAINNQFVKMSSGTMDVIKTYTDNLSIGSLNSVKLCGLRFCYTNGYIYYKSSDTQIYRAIVDDETETITSDALMINNTTNSFVLPYVTSDGKYFLSYTSYSYGGNFGNYFRIFTLVNNVLEEVSDISKLSSDLLPFYNNAYTTCVYNQQDDILVITNRSTREIAVFKYANDKFIKINGYIDTTSDSLYNLFATSSSDGTIIGYHCGRSGVGGKKPTVVQMKGDIEYKAVNYQNVNISSASLSGYVTKGGANNEIIQVKTILPPKLNVSVTVNADNAEISGGIE